MDIGFIGIGVMGQGMVRNLMKAGHSLYVFSRREASARAVVAEGARWCDSIRALCLKARLIISIVGFPRDVEEVYLGEGGLIRNAQPGSILIDMTTTSPRLAQQIYEAARARGLQALDAPVSGGDSGARNGTLAIMAGGDEAVFNECLPVFQAMGKGIMYEGPAGSGQHTKMANQIAIAGAVAGVAEAIAYAREAGLDVSRMIQTISGGAASSWQLANNGPKMVSGDFAPGFFIKHFIKDMALAQEEAQARGCDLPVLRQALASYRELEARGFGDEGTQALIRAYPAKR